METASQPGANGLGRTSKRKVWLMRGLLFLGAPLAFALALEESLRIAGYGRDTRLFIPDAKAGYFRTNPSFTAPFFPAQFDMYPMSFRIGRHKEPGSMRIFVLGESAAKGTPEPGFGFASLLGAQLRAAYPGRRFEVFNLGIVAINSHVVYQIARQAAEFEPDLFVVYMGNNEVVGPYGPGSVNLPAMPPLSVIRASIWTGQTRAGQLIANLLGKISTHAGRPGDWRGMGTFTDRTVRGDDPRLNAVYRNYEANLRDIVRVASRKGIKTIVATVVANLKDSPPFASIHRTGMTGTQLERWKRAYEMGTKLWELGLSDEAIDSLNVALKVDPEYADAHFVLGSLLEDKGDARGGRIHLLAALHWDALRFRPDAQINAIARRVASESPGSVILLDSALIMGSDAASEGPPSGREILLEHVHFNWDGNKRMARLLAEKSGAALFGAGSLPGIWLDGAGSAEALGYTDTGRLRMLRQMEPIWGKPPFTNQLTFGMDQVRHNREIELANAQAASPEGLARAREQLRTALLRNPDDPNLSLRLSEIDAESNLPDRSLELIDRVMELEPRFPDLLVQRSRLLASLGRYLEAQASILESIRMDPYHLPSYTELVEVLRRTRDFETGRKALSEALAGNPGSSFIRLTYADLLFFHGDRNEAIDECRTVLTQDPGNSDALRRLVSLYTGEGRTEQAYALMSEARRTQPLNFENNVALARIFNERGDDQNAADCLRAATLCGPADAEIHLFLASHMRKLNRPTDALLELTRAERVATLTGNSELARRISEEMRSQGANR